MRIRKCRTQHLPLARALLSWLRPVRAPQSATAQRPFNAKPPRITTLA